MRTKDVPQVLQLQFWNEKRGEYEPTGATADPTSSFAVRSLLANVRGKVRAWRVARADRPLKPARYVTGRRTASIRSAETVRSEYIDWAKDHGLASIHAYEGDLCGIRYARGMRVNYLSPEDQFRVEHTDESRIQELAA